MKIMQIMSMSLSCECERVHFSIYSIVRQQSEGSYQKTDVEKQNVHKRSSTRHTDSPTQNGGIYHRTASLSLLVFLFLGGWRRGVDSAATHRDAANLPPSN